ncbi:MAG: hypothetical protein IIA98_01210 [Proteobacteria bacterium]|nr:hypothetical protein [Pseudomonadota bacterium]
MSKVCRDGAVDDTQCLAHDLRLDGHIYHGELATDQLFFQRPVPHFADYRTPVHGLYQCGTSCHPGGGVSGVPGHNAAGGVTFFL